MKSHFFTDDYFVNVHLYEIVPREIFTHKKIAVCMNLHNFLIIFTKTVDFKLFFHYDIKRLSNFVKVYLCEVVFYFRSAKRGIHSIFCKRLSLSFRTTQELPLSRALCSPIFSPILQNSQAFFWAACQILRPSPLPRQCPAPAAF